MSILITNLSSLFTGSAWLGPFLDGSTYPSLATGLLPDNDLLFNTWFRQSLQSYGILILWLVLTLLFRGILNIIAGCILNTKAGKPWWFALIPLASNIMRCIVVAGRFWWIFLIPYVISFIPFTTLAGLRSLFFLACALFFRFCEARAYNAGPGITTLNMILPAIGRMVMAFSPAYIYQGPAAQFYVSKLFNIDTDNDPAYHPASAPGQNNWNNWNGWNNPANSNGPFTNTPYGAPNWNQANMGQPGMGQPGMGQAGAPGYQPPYPGMNQGQAYPNPGQAYPNPGQGYPNPGQAYPNPGQAYPNPGQGYPGPGPSSPGTNRFYNGPQGNTPPGPTGTYPSGSPQPAGSTTGATADPGRVENTKSTGNAGATENIESTGQTEHTENDAFFQDKPE